LIIIITQNPLLKKVEQKTSILKKVEQKTGILKRLRQNPLLKKWSKKPAF